MREHLPAILRIIADSASVLHQTLIRETGSNYVEYSRTERMVLEGLPVRPCPDITRDSHRLPILIYGSDPAIEAILHAWEQMFTALHTKASPRSMVNPLSLVFPDIQWRGLTLIEMAAIFIYACGWNNGGQKANLSFGRNHALLRFSKQVQIGIVDTNVIGLTARRRLRNTELFDVASALQRPLALRMASTARVAGLYRHLVKVLPDQAHVVHAIATAAVQAGAETQAALTEPFDLVMVPTAEPVAPSWAAARYLIQTATNSPVQELYRMLRADVGYSDFYKSFGNPHRALSRYTPAARAAHLAALARFEAGVFTTDTGALDLLQLQQQISSIHV